ncbi:hypothetical protein BS17DRAFT_763831 [Gyrodon lividus]|nr:hypothetical protein BS17DRAFT_763831 [Gyrodon lividus]
MYIYVEHEDIMFTAAAVTANHNPFIWDVQLSTTVHKNVLQLPMLLKKDTQQSSNLPENKAQGELLGLVSGSLKSLLNSWLLTPADGGTLDNNIEELILRVADVQKSAREIESNILQCRGVGPLLTSTQEVTSHIARAITMLEHILMANMEGSLDTLCQNKGLLYQNKADISYNNGVFQHLDDLLSFSLRIWTRSLPLPFLDLSLRTQAVKDLSEMLVNLFDYFKNKTGWAFTILAGGPDYSKNNKIKTLSSISIHVGETPLEMSFMQAYNAFGEQIMKLFDTFVHHIHADSMASLQGPSDTESGILMHSDGPEHEEDTISSDSGSSRQSLLSPWSDYASAASVYTGTTHASANHHASSSGNPAILAFDMSQSTKANSTPSFFSDNLMADSPTLFMRGTGSLHSCLPNLATAPTSAADLIPTPTPAPILTPTPTPSMTPVLMPPAHTASPAPMSALTSFVPTVIPTPLPVFTPTPAAALTPTPALAPTPTLVPTPTPIPMPVLTPMPVSTSMPTPTLAPAPALAPHPVLIPTPAVTPTPTPTMAVNVAVAQHSPPKKRGGKRTQVLSTPIANATPSNTKMLNTSGLAPHRSGCSVVPSTCNTVVNQIGVTTPKQGHHGY